ncbi:MAG: protoporphyrinogen oxidase [Candidatus Acidiferrales bacterium]
MTNSTRVAVIGAGISGLACAYRLQQSGVDVALLEASDHAGGLMGSIEKNGLLFETGPQSFQGTDELLDLIRELGIEGELQKADSRAPRYVYLHGHLRKIPMSPQALLTSSLLGPGSRWKIASEAFKRSKPPTEEETVASFVRRKFGHEILEYLVAPFVSGVYAGDPEQLSLKAAFPSLDEWERDYGSVLRGAMKSRPAKSKGAAAPSLCSFRHGVATLPGAMAGKLGERLQTGTTVLDIQHDGSSSGAGYSIRALRQGQEQRASVSAVVIATPAYAAGALLASVSTHAAQILCGVPYAPVAVVATNYYRQQVGDPLEGFGFLVPRGQKVRTLGTVWNSSLFAGRAREGTVTITSFIGGATDVEIVQHSEEEIARIVQDENAHILGITGPPIKTAVWGYTRALPQYNLGHGHIVEAIRDAERQTPGLFFAGNYLEGPAIGKCVENGFHAAEAVSRYLQSR